MRKSVVEPKIIFQDNYILVLDKPAGMVVNRAKTVKGPTVQDWVEKKLEIGNWKLEIPSDFVRRSGIVHRLDKETSGLLLIAKTKNAFENLQRQFKERKVKKKYLTLVRGKLEPKQGEIVLPISRTRKNREKFGVFPEGKKARTKYKILRYLKKFSLVEVELLTGRTHQIRVHFTFLGYPVAADLKYGGKRAKEDRLFCPRMFLHASRLGFYHPKNKNFCEFISPLPSELENAILRICEKSSS